MSDASGSSVIIEYIDGKVEVQELNKASKVLTNFRYFASENDLVAKTDEYRTSGKISKDVYGDSYLRYIKIREKLIASDGILNETDAMSLLRDVSMMKKSIYGDFYTVWSVVYNLETKRMRIAIGRDYDKIFSFELIKQRE